MVHILIILPKHRVRHAAKQQLKTGYRHDQARMDRKINDRDFDQIRQYRSFVDVRGG